HNHSRFVQYFSDCAAICATSRTISARSSSRCGEKSGVTIATEIQTRPGRRDTDWDSFLAQLEEVVMQHPVVTRNGYCEWFARGEADLRQVRDLVQQFSVFSNFFIVAQLLKTINAPNLEQARESCEILVN